MHQPLRLLLLTAMTPLLVAQTTIHVDVNATPPGNGSLAAPFPSIQPALSAALDGDTVLVRPGTYHESLVLVGRSITIESTAGPDTTVVDANNQDTVLQIAGLLASVSVEVNGFTFTNGNGTQFIGGRAGGVALAIAHASLHNCRITGNVGGRGAVGGIHISSGSLAMTRCEITNNTGGDMPFNKGGFSGRGGPGGLQVVDPVAAPLTLDLLDCLIAQNTGGDGFTFFFATGTGGSGGIELLANGLTIPNCRARNCNIVDNLAGNGDGAGRGGPGGLGLGPCNFELTNCTVADNAGGQVAGGGGTPGAGGIHCLAPSTSVDATNTIIWNNVDGSGNPSAIDQTLGAVVASSCDIQGGFAGPGNLNLDPLFRAAPANDYRLVAASPCIDAGDSAAANLPALDIEGDPRNVGGSVDIGADEGCWLGTDEGFTLRTPSTTGAAPDRCFLQLTPGDTVELQLLPPPPALVGSFALGYLQFRTNGSSGPVSPLGLPTIHVDPFSSLTLAYGIQPLPTSGASLVAPIPLGLSGLTIRAQYFALSPSATNGVFAATNAHEFEIQ